jgi:hypothetical protein
MKCDTHAIKQSSSDGSIPFLLNFDGLAWSSKHCDSFLVLTLSAVIVTSFLMDGWKDQAEIGPEGMVVNMQTNCRVRCVGPEIPSNNTVATFRPMQKCGLCNQIQQAFVSKVLRIAPGRYTSVCTGMRSDAQKRLGCTPWPKALLTVKLDEPSQAAALLCMPQPI